MNNTNGLSHIRNIGIIAHIDSGKTTLSERVLFYSGRTYKMGEVHDGTTTLDYMDEERERGISITSASTTCSWKGHRINLIDTPGHVDFTAEVERSLRVLDGAVVVFCGVAGVEAQSEKVWHQADRYKVPRIAFVNKLDRVGSDLDKVVASMRAKLRANAVPIQIPVGREKEFRGVIDLVSMMQEAYEDQPGGTKSHAMPISDDYRDLAEDYREQMLEKLSDESDELMDLYLHHKPVPTEMIMAAIRKGTVAGRLTPVLCGSALKNRGVRKLLDAVCDYLPSPLDLQGVTGTTPHTGEELIREIDPEGPLCALAFKTISVPTGDLTFIRVYSGTLKRGESVYNSTRDCAERVGRLVLMHADKQEGVEEAAAGEIVASIGLKRTMTGDTLCSDEHPILLSSMNFPDPVISQSISAKNKADRDRLGEALAKLCREDPTFHRHVDSETDEMIIAGMGELHLEIKVNLLRREHRMDVEVGVPKVAYRLTLTRGVKIEARHIKQTGGHGQYAVVELEFTTQHEEAGLDFEDKTRGGSVPREYIGSIERGLKAEMERGAGFKFPIVNLRAHLVDGSAHDVDSSPMAFEIAAGMALRMAVEKVGVVLLEPVMKLEVQMPEEYVGDVIGDLNSRRTEIAEITPDPGTKYIRGRVPICEMFQYSTVIRSLTKGRGAYSMEPQGYAQVPRNLAEPILKAAHRHPTAE